MEKRLLEPVGTTMVSPGGVAGVVLLLAIHTLLAAVTIRFIRLYASTRTGTALAIIAVVPLVLLLSTLVLSGPFHLGVDMGDPSIAAIVAIAIPLVIGLAIDYRVVASPDEVDAALAE